MNDFKLYVDKLHSLLVKPGACELIVAEMGPLEVVLDGQPGRVLRACTPIEQLRSNGTFFSSAKLARLVKNQIKSSVTEESVIYDPACGAGDLLIPFVEDLPVGRDVRSTIIKWAKRFRGRDTVPEFVQATRLRLLIALLRRLDSTRLRKFEFVKDAFPEIRTGCGRSDSDALERATHIVLNPPFTVEDASRSCQWSTGAVSSAAVFLEACVEKCSGGTHLVAVLPDVLRSGSRYHKWRASIEARMDIRSVCIYGRFDPYTDIDVFILHGLKRKQCKSVSVSNWVEQCRSDNETVGTHFEVLVGSVVDYRDPKSGKEWPFMTSRDAPPWGRIKRVSRKRRFAGHVFRPPFVVVKRTSGPADPHRALAAIVIGKRQIAVENHLLILVPRHRSIRKCEELLKVLQHEATNAWLNRRIRCRHLTKSAMAQVPWKVETK